MRKVLQWSCPWLGLVLSGMAWAEDAPRSSANGAQISRNKAASVLGNRPVVAARSSDSDRNNQTSVTHNGVLIAPAPYSVPRSNYQLFSVVNQPRQQWYGSQALRFGPQTIAGAENTQQRPIGSTPAVVLNVQAGTQAQRRLGLFLSGPIAPGWQDTHVAISGLHQAEEDQRKFTADIPQAGDGQRRNAIALRLQQRWGRWLAWADMSHDRQSRFDTALGLAEQDLRQQPQQRYAASQLDSSRYRRDSLQLGLEQQAASGLWQAMTYSHHYRQHRRRLGDFRNFSINEVLADPNGRPNARLLEVLRGERDANLMGSQDDLLVNVSTERFRASGIQGQWQQQFAQQGWHSLVLGARWHSDRRLQQAESQAYDMVGGRLQAQLAVANSGTNTSRTEAQAGALWALTEWRWGSLRLQPALRLEHVQSRFEREPNAGNGMGQGPGQGPGAQATATDNSDHYTLVLPGLGLRQQVSPLWYWRADVHRGFSPIAATLEDDLPPETALSTELGLGGQWQTHSWGVTVFHRRHDDVSVDCRPDTCLSNRSGSQTDAGSVTLYGAEAQWQKSWAMPAGLRLNTALAYRFVQGQFNDDFQSSSVEYGQVNAGDELPYLANHKAATTLELQHQNWQLGVSGAFTSAARAEAGTGPRGLGTDRFTVWGLNGRWQLNTTTSLELQVRNVFDRAYIASRGPLGAQAGPGRSAAVSLRLDF